MLDISFFHRCKLPVWICTDTREGDLAFCIRTVPEHASDENQAARMGDALSIRVCSYLLMWKVAKT